MTQHKNILFVLTDQWPATHFSFRGSPVQTPNVDRLASQGTVFTNAHSPCPLCSPARGVLLSGMWPWKTGMYDNYSTGYSTQEPYDLGVHTWIDASAERGFHVGYFGKWHLGPDGPALRGAHETTEGIDRGRAPFDNDKRKHSYQMAADHAEKQTNRLREGRPWFYGILKDGIEDTHAWQCSREAIGFLERYGTGDREKPFFLTASFTGPHFPHFLPEEYANLYRPEDIELPASLEDTFAGKPFHHGKAWWPSMDTSVLDHDAWRKAIAYTWGHMTMVDAMVGDVLRTLERCGLEGDTLIVFGADHGDMCGEHSRFDKGAYFYEEVIRVPLIIKQPGGVAAEQPAHVSLVDLGATLFAAVGEEAYAERTHGRNLLPLLGSSQEPEGWPREAFATYHRYNGMSFECRCIRTDRYKYVWNMQEVDELYDLESDPIEMNNLSGNPDYAAIEGDLAQRVRQWLSDTGDPVPDNLTDLPKAGTIIFTGEAGP